MASYCVRILETEMSAVSAGFLSLLYSWYSQITLGKGNRCDLSGKLGVDWGLRGGGGGGNMRDWDG